MAVDGWDPSTQVLQAAYVFGPAETCQSGFIGAVFSYIYICRNASELKVMARHPSLTTTELI